QASSVKRRGQLSRESETFVVCVCFLVRFLTRPTNHPRHAACASNDESKPVRPQIIILEQVPLFAVLCNSRDVLPSNLNGNRNNISIFGRSPAGGDNRLQREPPPSAFGISGYG